MRRAESRNARVEHAALASCLALVLLASACSVEPLLTVGRRCADDSQCAPGLVCDRLTNRCNARATSPDIAAPRFDTGPVDDADGPADSADARADIVDATPRELSMDTTSTDSTVDATLPDSAVDTTADTTAGTPCCTRRVCKTGSCHLFTIANLTITGLTDKDADGCRVYGDPDAVPSRLRIIIFKGGVLRTLALHNGSSSGGQVVTFTSNLPGVTVTAQYATQGGSATTTELVCQ